MEIERKFLVNRARWEECRNPEGACSIQQAYLSRDPACSVRIRITDNQAFLTIKGEADGISREEFEYPIPVSDGLNILQLAPIPTIIKQRYLYPYQGYTWEVDEFLGENMGLILAEVELEDVYGDPELPEWIDKEVSGDPRYFNLQLAINPINQW